MKGKSGIVLWAFVTVFITAFLIVTADEFDSGFVPFLFPAIMLAVLVNGIDKEGKRTAALYEKSYKSVSQTAAKMRCG